MSPASHAEDRSFPHMQYEFLQPNKIRDAAKRCIDDPEYDPRTLYVPDSFLKDQTPVNCSVLAFGFHVGDKLLESFAVMQSCFDDG